MKIISYGNITKEGILLKFDKKIKRIEGGISTDEWWLSWDKISDLIKNDFIEEEFYRKEIKQCPICGTEKKEASDICEICGDDISWLKR